MSVHQSKIKLVQKSKHNGRLKGCTMRRLKFESLEYCVLIQYGLPLPLPYCTQVHAFVCPFSRTSTAWKVSKYGVFSGPYFPVFGLNTEIYSVNLRIQSKYRKLRTRKNSIFGHFSRSNTYILFEWRLYFVKYFCLFIWISKNQTKLKFRKKDSPTRKLCPNCVV